MRIDYSEPKKSRSAPQASQKRTCNVSFGGVVIIVIITAMISLGIGFGSGLMFSRRPVHPPQQTTNPPSPAAAQKQTTTTGTSKPAGDLPLEFYTRLKNGQKQAPLGSGINLEENKPAKQASPLAPATRTDANGSRQ